MGLLLLRSKKSWPNIAKDVKVRDRKVALFLATFSWITVIAIIKEFGWHGFKF